MTSHAGYPRVRAARSALWQTFATILGRAGLHPAWLASVLAIAAVQIPLGLAAAAPRGGGPVTATAISEHFLEVRFAGRADSEWSSAAAYRITAADGSPLAVQAVDMSPEGDTADEELGALVRLGAQLDHEGAVDRERRPGRFQGQTLRRLLVHGGPGIAPPAPKSVENA